MEYTYDPSQITLNTDSAAANEDALLKTVEPTVTDNEDGTQTVRFTYGIKKQDAFKKTAELMNVLYGRRGSNKETGNCQCILQQRRGTCDESGKSVTYVPNNFTYEDLGALIQDAEATDECSSGRTETGRIHPGSSRYLQSCC